MSFFQTLLGLLILTYAISKQQVGGEGFENEITLTEQSRRNPDLILKTINNFQDQQSGGTSQHFTNDTALVADTNFKIISLNGTVEEDLQFICQVLNITHCTCDEVHAHNVSGFCEVTREKPCTKSTMELVKYISITIISFLGIIGNILVLVVRVRNWKKSLHYQLISGLAMADLAFCCMFLIICFPSIWLCQWHLGDALCTLLKTLWTFSSNVDLGFILIIAIERYAGIVHPFSGGASACKIYLMILMNLVVGLMSVSHFFLIFRVNELGQCAEDWSSFSENSSFIYSWVSNIFLFTIPIIITAVLYYQGLRSLNLTLFRPDMMRALDEMSRERMVSENRRILKITSLILLAFFLLVGPNHAAWFLHDNFPNLDLHYVFTISYITYSLHTSINPLIYSIIDRKFRKNVFFLLRKRRRCNSFTTTVTAENTLQIYQLTTTEFNSGPTEDSQVEL